MIYNIFHALYLKWMDATWTIWRRHRAWDIVNGADFDDPYEVESLHYEAVSRDELLLHVQLESLLDQLGVETIFL